MPDEEMLDEITRYTVIKQPTGEWDYHPGIRVQPVELFRWYTVIDISDHGFAYCAEIEPEWAFGKEDPVTFTFPRPIEEVRVWGPDPIRAWKTEFKFNPFSQGYTPCILF